MNLKSWVILIMASLLLTSCDSRYCIVWCHNETSIQNDYVYARNDCQDDAQDQVSSSSRNVSNYNAALLEAFARCMKREGWGVTSPKKTNSKKGGPNDTSTLSGNPWDPSPYGVQQQQAARAAQAQQGYPPPTIQQPYGYAPQQPAYGYAPQQQLPQQYQRAPQQSYNQGYTPQRTMPPQQGYGYAPQPMMQQRPIQQQQMRPQQRMQPMTQQQPMRQYNYSGQSGPQQQPYGALDAGPENSNRAGIGLAPGF